MGIFNLEEQINFYAQYHNNPINQLVHMIFVPTILWSVLVWCTYTGPFVETGLLPEWLPLNLALVVGSFYAGYYLILEPVAGTLYLPVMLSMLYMANWFQHLENAVLLSVGIHILSWVMQILAHQFVEHRSPALLDNLFQALVLAPLFVWLETLFMFGYRRDLATKIDRDAKTAIKAWRASQHVRKNKAALAK